MSQALIASLYCITAIMVAAFCCRLCFPDRKPIIYRVGFSWIVLTCIAFFVANQALYYILTALALFKLCPKDIDERLLFYGAMLPTIPGFLNWLVPFPGINYLVELDYIKTLNIVVLLPLILATFNKDNSPRLAPSGVFKATTFIVLYFACIIILDWRENSVTNAARHSLDILWITGITVYALQRACNTPDSVNGLYFGLLIAAFFLAVISLFQAMEGWKFYTEISRSLSSRYSHLYNISYIRGNFLRTPATMAPIPLGIYMSFAVLLLYKFRSQSHSTFVLICFFCLFLFAIFTTGSRAGYLSLVILFGIYFFLNPRLKALRGLIAFAAVVLMLPYYIAGISLDQFSEYDEHGTFEYRINLFFTSVELVQENFFFGSRYYNKDPALEALRQGQGIIDIVNTYLHIAMRYGMSGLSLLALSLFTVVTGLLRARKEQEITPYELNSENTIRTTIAIICAFCVSITTVSFIDRLETYFWLFIAIGVCLIRQHKQMLYKAQQA